MLCSSTDVRRCGAVTQPMSIFDGDPAVSGPAPSRSTGDKSPRRTWLWTRSRQRGGRSNHADLLALAARHGGSGLPAEPQGQVLVNLEQLRQDGPKDGFGGSARAVVTFQGHTKTQLRNGRAVDPFRAGLHE